MSTPSTRIAAPSTTRPWALLAGLFVLLAASAAYALPQFAVRSARACDTCHVDPTGWVDPEVKLRKCSLNCNTCHVSPSGAGLRNESGIYYGRQTLPMFGDRPADNVYQPVTLAAPANASRPTSQPAGAAPASQPASQPAGSAPASQPMAAASQPAGAAPASQPMAAASQPGAPASQPMAAASQPAGGAPASQPMAAGSQPAGAAPASQPAGPPRGPDKSISYPMYVAAPGTAGRYGGIEPHPTFQIGADVRMMLYAPVDADDPRAPAPEASFFPMQADLYLAARPYNPAQLNEGRLTLLLNTGFLGSRGEQFDGMGDRFFVREYFAMYHDLPYQVYARAGRFLPAWGWRTDDHTPFVRQGQVIFEQPFDHERQVTGVEIGINPNYFYGHFSLFNAPDFPMTVENFSEEGVDPFFTADGAYGAALAAGWRDLAWHAGGALIYGNRGAIGDPDVKYDQVALSAEWALNVDVIAGELDLPLTYIGQYTVNHRAVDGERSTTGLAAMHQVDYLITRGISAMMRYDWADSDVEVAFDSRHRLQLGFDIHPYTYLELNVRYRHNWTNTEERASIGGDDLVFIVHGWY